MAVHRARLQQFEEFLESDVIDLKQLRKMCFKGCPFETSSSRSLSWKLLLNYLPRKRADWEEVLAKERNAYKQFIDEMIVKPGSKGYGSNRIDVTLSDHPLNPNPESEWSTYFADNEMLVQVDKDCRRLCPDLSFFQQASDYPCKELNDHTARVETLQKRVENSVLKSETVSRNRHGITNMLPTRRRTSTDDFLKLPPGQEAHWEVCERILFIYAKLNPGQGYVQGMNEILGPIYYVFATDPCEDNKAHAEADAFFCFTNLMGEIRDNFIKSLDDSEHGIGNLMKSLMALLKEKDSRLWSRLEMNNLKPEFYAFRWLTLLLSQEFQLPDVLRLWDSLFSDEGRFQFLIYVCCAMLILIRQEMFDADFSMMMKLLQNYPLSDVQLIVNKAAELRGDS
ncbi:TBC1 domain family member 13-like isoform X1 [Tubulanus polymorphus]|uniref:TBC1 domain family member 13-like isoform X1 n=2 Tax=Tubulanus polymorphus TaxID=672921 RepID=UPI003DA21EED